MLLVLSQPGDPAAERFTAWAQADGVACARPLDWRDVDLSVHATRDSRVRVELRVGAQATPIRAVFNRGLPIAWDTEEQDRFQHSEVLATWWTALAAFPGPVVNRPMRAGYIPSLNPSVLVASVPGLCRRGFVGPPRHNLPDAPVVNVHRFRDGLFVGRLADQPDLDQDELYQYVPFDPARVVRLLLAGRRVFDLSQPDGRLDADLERRLDPLISELRRQQATFSLAFVERTADHLYLLNATAHPFAHQYQHLEVQVHQALLDMLAS